MLVGILLPVLIYGTKSCSSSRLSRIKYTILHLIINSFTVEEKDGNSPESEVSVEMQRRGAYEVVRLSQQRITMKDNPAYVDVNLYQN